MFIKSVEILNRLVGEGNWITIAGLDYDTIVLQDGVSVPSREDFDRVKAEVEQLSLSLQYQTQRAPEYPDVKDQLDMLWHGMDSGEFPKVNSFYEAIKSIKDKYPKDL
jgi:hypothetical protein